MVVESRAVTSEKKKKKGVNNFEMKVYSAATAACSSAAWHVIGGIPSDDAVTYQSLVFPSEEVLSGRSSQHLQQLSPQAPYAQPGLMRGPNRKG